MDFDDIERRLDRLEAGLNEVKALVRQEVEKSNKPAGSPSPVVTKPAVSPFPVATNPAFWSQVRPAQKTPVMAPPAVAPAPAPQPSVTPPRSFSSMLGTPGTGELEANLLGSWFARAGAVAIFLGAVFAFKYAVDRNLISPAGRVAIGLMAGLAFIAWGEWARRKSWPLFAQAVAGVGVAIGYLSIWAGYQLYDLMSPAVALVLLALVVVGGGALAIRHNSIALAVLATLGGFLNPILVSTGRGSEIALYTYLLVLDLGVVALSHLRKWRALNAVALFGTWFLVFLGTVTLEGAQGGELVGLAFATLYLLLFHAVSLMSRTTGAPSDETDVALLGFNAVAYFGFGILVLEGGAESMLALLLGLAHIGAGLAFRQMASTDETLTLTLIGLGVASLTIAAGLQFTGPVLSTIWALEAMALAAAGTQKGLSKLQLAGAGIFALSVLTTLADYRLGLAYEPAFPLVSLESLPFVVQILALALAGYALRQQTGMVQAKAWADTAAVLANIMALVWISFELWAAFNRSDGWSAEGFTFTLSSVWTLYASALLAYGIAQRAKWARLMSVGLFGLVVIKLVMADVWLLETPLRIAAFIGLGLVLLLCSLGYHRFRELILGPDESSSTPSGSPLIR